MSTADKLNKLLETKQAIKQAIIDKGVEVADDTVFADYPSKISSIPMEGGDPYYEDFYNLRTNNGTSMRNLFYGCDASQLDLSKLDTSKVTDMNYMFSCCSSQITLGNWDLSNLLYTDYMFQGFNNSSNYIDLSILDFSNATSISCMFESCNLNYVDIRNLNFDWSKVTNLYGMFCYADGVLDLSNWDITGLTNMNSMIYSYYGKKIDLTNWITTSVTDMSSNFCDCPNLEELIIPDWDMTNAPGSSMLSGCNNLRYVDISRCNEFTIAEITALLPEKTSDNFGTIKVPENTSQEVCDTLIAKYWKPVGVAISTVPTSCNIVAELDELMPSGSTKVYITSEPWYADTSKVELVVSDNSMATITDDNEVISTGVVGNIELAARLIDTQEIIGTKTIVVSETDSHPGLIKIRLNPDTYGSTQINNSSHSLEIWNWTQEANNIYSYDIGDTITEIYFGHYITELIRVNTSNITSAINMFNGTLLQKFNARNFDTSNITELSGMFANCHELIELDLSSFNTSNVTNMYQMFYDCDKLTSLDISNFNTQFASLGDMFYNCFNLHTIRMDNCSHTTIFEIINNASIPTNAIDGVTRTIYCKESEAAGLTPPTNWVFSYVTEEEPEVPEEPSIPLYVPGQFANNSEITEVRTMVNTSHDNLSEMFSGCTNLVSVNTQDWDTSNVTDMYFMFYNCNSLTELDVSNFDTSKVTRTSYMFSSCSKLTSLDLSNFDTSNVTDMNTMFSSCSNLTSIDLSNFDTSNVTDMMDMFNGCYNLTSLDLSNFNTNKVAKISNMFGYCGSLEELDLRNFDVSNVITDYDNLYFSGIFCDCYKLHTLRLDNCSNYTINKLIASSYFPTDAIEGVTRTIYCKEENAAGLTPPTNWVFSFITEEAEGDISLYEVGQYKENMGLTEVKTMVNESHTDLSEMFLMCMKLESVNTQDWTITNVTNMSFMFFNCRALQSLDLSNWDMTNVTNTENMFDNCTSLHTLRLDNCNNDTISKIINSSKFPASNAGTIYCKEENAAGLTPPTNWVFSYVTEEEPEVPVDPPAGDIPLYEYGQFAWREDITEVRVMVNDTNTELNSMFNGCTNLVSVNTEDWDTSNAITMNAMFRACSSLTTLDLSSFITNKVTDMQYMFAYCSSLEELDISNFDMCSVESCYDMFRVCPSLHILHLDNCSYDTINKIINGSSMSTEQAEIGGEYITRKIYCKEANVAGLTAPENWEFVFVD